jgi:hypothetical protein
MPGWLVGISSIRPLRGPDRRADDDAGQFETASKRIDAAKQARILAAETLAAGETRLRAMADYNIAVARYEQATGTTLARHAITLAD